MISASHECHFWHILEVRVSHGKSYLLSTSVKRIYMFPRRHAAENGIHFISHQIACTASSICDCSNAFTHLRLRILLHASATARTPSSICPLRCFSSSPWIVHQRLCSASEWSSLSNHPPLLETQARYQSRISLHPQHSEEICQLRNQMGVLGLSWWGWGLFSHLPLLCF